MPHGSNKLDHTTLGNAVIVVGFAVLVETPLLKGLKALAKTHLALVCGAMHECTNHLEAGACALNCIESTGGANPSTGQKIGLHGSLTKDQTAEVTAEKFAKQLAEYFQKDFTLDASVA